MAKLQSGHECCVSAEAQTDRQRDEQTMRPSYAALRGLTNVPLVLLKVPIVPKYDFKITRN
jgi:hypothetical protein